MNGWTNMFNLIAGQIADDIYGDAVRESGKRRRAGRSRPVRTGWLSRMLTRARALLFRTR